MGTRAAGTHTAVFAKKGVGSASGPAANWPVQMEPFKPDRIRTGRGVVWGAPIASGLADQ